MKFVGILAILLSAFAIPAVASAPDEASDTRRITSDQGLAARLLAIRSELEIAGQMARGGADRAASHLRTPLEELWPAIHGTLEARDAAVEMRLETALAEAAAAETAAEMVDRAGAALASVDATLEALLPQTTRKAARFRLALARILLDDAVARYAQGVSLGRLVNLSAYESAYALARSAAGLVSSLASGAGERDTAATVADLLQELKTALPSLDPPERLLPAGRLQALVSRIELQFGSLV